MPHHGPLIKRHANLPHWTQPGSTYAVTFRLADALPAAVVDRFRRERENIIATAAQMRRDLAAHEVQRLEYIQSERIQEYLDGGAGTCILRDERTAIIVRDALTHFDGERYDLLAWCIMPNHVHVVFTPHTPHDVSSITHSWKSFTATMINRLHGRRGSLWQKESYDHIIRDQTDLTQSIQYVMDNPVKAKLTNWKWAWSK